MIDGHHACVQYIWVSQGLGKTRTFARKGTRIFFSKRTARWSDAVLGKALPDAYT